MARPDTSNPNVSAKRGWHSRGYLPHCDSVAVVQFVTFRLADSLPQEKLRQIKESIRELPDTTRDVRHLELIDHWLDSVMGCCALSHPQMAMVMQKALLHFDNERYQLIAWCIMPNHVHILIETKSQLSKIMQSWKSFTGRWALAHNAELELGVPRKQFWMREYWDRFIRDDEHLLSTINYIHQNPVKAGLCHGPQDWRWSSATENTDT